MVGEREKEHSRLRHLSIGGKGDNNVDSNRDKASRSDVSVAWFRVRLKYIGIGARCRRRRGSGKGNNDPEVES